jgi:hypothetical protein
VLELHEQKATLMKILKKKPKLNKINTHIYNLFQFNLIINIVENIFLEITIIIIKELYIQ